MKNQSFSLGSFISKIKRIAILGIVLISAHSLFAQEKTNSELYKTLKKLDAILFVNGFNKCQHEAMEPYISEDLEFYHDQGGISLGKEAFFKSMKENICSNWKKKPIRKLMNESLEVFPLYNNGKLYGAIQKGIHEFYIKEANKDLYLTSTAKFTHVWLLKNEQWQMKRVLSYDHQTPKKAEKTALKLSDKALQVFVGKYEAPNTGKITIGKTGSGLEMNAGEMHLELFPETESLFFNKQMPLTFEFVSNTKGEITKMVIREHGKIVEEAKRVK